jgi:Fe-S-cluster formation regulator IscX/YfhJ
MQLSNAVTPHADPEFVRRATDLLKVIARYVDLSEDPRRVRAEILAAESRVRAVVLRYAIMAYGQGMTERELDRNLAGAVWFAVDRVAPKAGYRVTFERVRDIVRQAALIEHTHDD